MIKNELATDCLEFSTDALRQIAQLVNRTAWAHWSSLHISPTQQRILEILSREIPGQSLIELAHELGTTASTASDSLSSLERKGLVVRQRSHSDKRKMSPLLTRAGLHRFELLTSQPDPLHDALAALSDCEQRKFRLLVAKLVSSLAESGHLRVHH